MADTTARGCATVQEYKSSDIAINDMDNKRIHQAEYRVMKSIKQHLSHNLWR